MAEDPRPQVLKRSAIFDEQGRLRVGAERKLADASPFTDHDVLKGSALDALERASKFDRSGVIR